MANQAGWNTAQKGLHTHTHTHTNICAMTNATHRSTKIETQETDCDETRKHFKKNF